MNKRKEIDFLNSAEQLVDQAVDEGKKAIKEFSYPQRKNFFTWGKIGPTAIAFILLVGLIYTTRVVWHQSFTVVHIQTVRRILRHSWHLL